MMNEQELEDLCIGWFQEAGWRFATGPSIAPEGVNPERADYRQVILRDRLLATLARINPHIPIAALEQAVHSAEIKLDSTKLGRDVGDRTTLDVLNSEQELHNTRLALARGRYQVLQALLNLSAAAGELDETRLQEINQVFGQ